MILQKLSISTLNYADLDVIPPKEKLNSEDSYSFYSWSQWHHKCQRSKFEFFYKFVINLMPDRWSLPPETSWDSSCVCLFKLPKSHPVFHISFLHSLWYALILKWGKKNTYTLLSSYLSCISLTHHFGIKRNQSGQVWGHKSGQY